MQAGIALHVRDRRPEQAYEALEAIKSTSKQALDELRRTLVVAGRQSRARPRPRRHPACGSCPNWSAEQPRAGSPCTWR